MMEGVHTPGIQLDGCVTGSSNDFDNARRTVHGIGKHQEVAGVARSIVAAF